MKISNKMKILYIHEYIFDYSEPGFTKPLELLNIIKKSNNDAVLLSGMYSHITRKKIEKYKYKLIFKEKINDVYIIRFSGFFNLTSFFHKLLNHFFFMVFSFFGGLFIKNISVIYASSPSPFAALSGYFLSFLKRVPFVLEIRDLWPDDLIQEGLLEKGLKSSIMEKVMVFLYKKADLIITVTKGIREGIINKGIKENKIKILTNSVNLELFSKEVDGKNFKEKIGLKNEFVVLYAGNHQVSNALDKIIDAANILKDNKDIVFVFVGSGEEKINLIKKTKSLNLKNVIFVEPQPKTKMPEVYAMADLSVVSLKKVPVYDGALPNKLLDSMASGKPVLLAVGEEAKGIIENSGGGIWVEPENPEEIAKGVLFFYQNKDIAKEMGKKGRDYVIKNFSNESAAQKLEEILRDVVASKFREK